LLGFLCVFKDVSIDQIIDYILVLNNIDIKFFFLILIFLLIISYPIGWGLLFIGICLGWVRLCKRNGKSRFYFWRKEKIAVWQDDLKKYWEDEIKFFKNIEEPWFKDYHFFVSTYYKENYFNISLCWYYFYRFSCGSSQDC
jgi:hypothetical protein